MEKEENKHWEILVGRRWSKICINTVVTHILLDVAKSRITDNRLYFV